MPKPSRPATKASDELAQAQASASLDFCLRLTRAHASLKRRRDNALSAVHGPERV